MILRSFSIPTAAGALALLIGGASAGRTQAATCGAPDFQAAPVIGVPFIFPDGVSVADFNGDGNPDIVAVAYGTQYGGDGIEVFLGAGNGTFTPAAFLDPEPGPGPSYVADLNGDGKQDIAVFAGDYFSGAVTLAAYLGDGAGNFGSAIVTQIGTGLGGIALGDFNGDGKPDFAVVVGSQSPSVTIFLGNGDGSFQPGPSFPIGYLYSGLAAGDINGDGNTDLVLSNPQENSVSILLGIGDGTFQPPLDVFCPSPGALALLDINGDNHVDVAVLSQASAELLIFLGNGDGTLAQPVTYPTEPLPTSILVGDLNGDGKPDIVVDNTYTGVSTFLNLGDGTLGSRQTFFTARENSAAAVGDLNGDGHLDVVVAEPEGWLALLFGDGMGSLRATHVIPGVAGLGAYAAADLDGDGNIDIAAVQTGNKVTTLLGDGSGNFALATTVGLTFPPEDLALDDFNGDGIPDIAVLGGGIASVFFGVGGGHFRAAGTYPINSNSTSAIVAADFNGDGFPDLGINDPYDDRLFVMLNDGGGGFWPPVSYSTLGGFSILATDLNGDGVIDLIIGGTGANNAAVGVLLGNGDGSFRPPLASGWLLYSSSPMVVDDLNGDAIPDLVFAGGGVLLGNGDGTFREGQPVPFLAYQSPAGNIRLGDVNGDGMKDLIATFPNTDNFLVSFGNGDATFGPPALYQAGPGPFGLAICDVNNDGLPDLVTGLDLAGVLGVNRNTTFAFPSRPPVAATVGVPYAATVTALGGQNPIFYAVVAGGLPPGISLSPAGALAGTPGAGGIFNFKLQATDAAGCAVTHDDEMVVYSTNPGPAITGISPYWLTPGTGPTALRIQGEGFTSSSGVLVNGQPVEAQPVSQGSMTATLPAALAAIPSVLSVSVTNPGPGGGQSRPFGLVVDYLDVPSSNNVHFFVDHITEVGIAAGCGNGDFCPLGPVQRSQMAVFLLRARMGAPYVPPPAVGIFADVPASSPFAPWIEALYSQGVTGGCGTNPLVYCPSAPVNRTSMAVLLLRAKYGSAYAPPPCTGIFTDVPCPGPFTNWIEQLYNEGITGGCDTNPLKYCLSDSVTRAQMSVFLTVTFALP